VDAHWTLAELVAQVAERLAGLPPLANGQIRAVPDERTIRYYAAIGLLDRPAAMRGRTALYGPRHAAQVVAIKRLQALGRSLADIQAMWVEIDDAALQRISGVALGARPAPKSPRGEFWKQAPATTQTPSVAVATSATDVRVELAPNVFLTIALDDGRAISGTDIRALRAAAAPLLTELASRRLTTHAGGGDS
jgi:hypothetical protein